MSRWVRSAAAVLAALLSPAMTAEHTKAKPDQRTYKCGQERQQPHGPLEVPEQELDGDVVGVLKHEDRECRHAAERRNGAASELASAGLRRRRNVLHRHQLSPPRQTTP